MIGSKKTTKKRTTKKKRSFENPRGTWLYHSRYGGKKFMPGDEDPGEGWVDDWKAVE